MHKNGYIVIDTGNLLDNILTVGWVVTGTGGDWTGFDRDAPCKAVISSLDPYPVLKVHPAQSDFKSNMSLALYCKRHTTDTVYEYCLTFDTEIDFTADVHVNEAIKLVINIDKLAITIMGVIDSARGSISYWLINFAISAAIGTITFILNNFLQGGFDMNYIVKDLLGITFFYFKKLVIVEQEALVFARLTPGFTIPWINNGTTSIEPVDLTSLSNMVADIGFPTDTSAQGIEQYVSDKLGFAALDL